jgi:hypothetical protein
MIASRGRGIEKERSKKVEGKDRGKQRGNEKKIPDGDGTITGETSQKRRQQEM